MTTFTVAQLAAIDHIVNSKLASIRQDVAAMTAALDEIRATVTSVAEALDRQHRKNQIADLLEES